MTTAGASGKNEQKKETDSKDGGWNLIQWSKGGTDAPESWQWLCWHHAELLVTKQFLVSRVQSEQQGRTNRLTLSAVTEPNIVHHNTVF